jgi:hypothetical protein
VVERLRDAPARCRDPLGPGRRAPPRARAVPSLLGHGGALLPRPGASPGLPWSPADERGRARVRLQLERLLAPASRSCTPTATSTSTCSPRSLRSPSAWPRSTPSPGCASAEPAAGLGTPRGSDLGPQRPGKRPPEAQACPGPAPIRPSALTPAAHFERLVRALLQAGTSGLVCQSRTGSRPRSQLRLGLRLEGETGPSATPASLRCPGGGDRN